MATLGLCILCDEMVKEDDHRREIDCPSKNCPGRIFHEECIATYLRRTKYNKDRCTGFPCPATLKSGKPCPGYVCKMHEFFPANQKKRQARLEAAVAVASAAKPRPQPANPKLGLHAVAAMAAMKVAGPEVPPPKAVPKPPRNPGAVINPTIENPKGNPAPEPRLIPGLDIDDLGTQRGPRRGKPKAPVKAPNGNVIRNNVVNAGWSDSNMKETGAAEWISLTSHQSPDGHLNHFDLERHKQLQEQQHGGQFSAALRKRRMGGAIADNDANSKREFDVHTTKMRDAAGPQACSDSIDSRFGSPNLDATSASGQCRIVTPQTNNDGNPTAAVLVVPPQDDDPVVEYDLLYGADDGTYLVLDAVSNYYFRLEDIYGASPELMECTGDDGNIYTCVAVRRSQRELRAKRQMAWFEAQEINKVPRQLEAEQVVVSTGYGAKSRMAGMTCPDAPLTPAIQLRAGYNTPDTVAQGAAQDDDASSDSDTDVSTLMKLLCV